MADSAYTGDDLSALAAATAKGEGLVLHRGVAFADGALFHRTWPRHDAATANRLKFPPAPSWSITRWVPRAVCHAAEPLPDVLHAGRALKFKVMVEQQILPRLRDRLPCLNRRCVCV